MSMLCLSCLSVKSLTGIILWFSIFKTIIPEVKVDFAIFI